MRCACWSRSRGRATCASCSTSSRTRSRMGAPLIRRRDPRAAPARAGADPADDTPRLATFQEHERSLIERTLALTRGNKLRAARELGISRKKLYAGMARYGLMALLAGMLACPELSPSETRVPRALSPSGARRRRTRRPADGSARPRSCSIAATHAGAAASAATHGGESHRTRGGAACARPPPRRGRVQSGTRRLQSPAPRRARRDPAREPEDS